MKNLSQDLRHGFRVLLKNPGFTVAAIIVLALGIGANTAIFSIVNAVLLRPLPFGDPARLVQVWHVPPPKSFPGMTMFSVSAANFIDWHEQNHVFDQMAVYSGSSLNLTGREQPEALQGAAVSSDFFSTLQAYPMIGRAFTPEEDQPGKNHVVILSYGLWKSRCAADPNITGRNVSFDGQPYTVAGVMGEKFALPGWAQYWTPMGWTNAERAVRGEHHYSVIARLKPGIILPQAQAEMNAISTRLEQQYPEDDKGAVRTSTPPRDMVSAVTGAIHAIDSDQSVTDVMSMDDLIATSLSQRRFSMLLLAAFAGLALLLAAVGIYSVLAFAVRRRVREIGIRMALGAEVKDILRLIVSEGMKPALLGVAIGLAGALALGRVLASLIYGLSATDPLTFAAVAGLLCLVALMAKRRSRTACHPNRTYPHPAR